MKNKSMKHWIVLACCAGIASSSIGAVINTIGVFLSPVAESLGVLRGTYALTSTILTIVIAIVSLFTPTFMKKIPFKVLILIGALLTGGSTVLMSMVSAMSLFYLLSVAKGVGAAIYNAILITTILNNWFKEMNGLATSISLSFSGVAGAVLSPILTSIIQSSGWRMAYVVLGIVTFALTLPAILYPFHIDPREDGLLPYGANEEELNTNTTVSKQNNSKFNPFQGTFILFLIAAVLYCSITSLSSHLPGYAQSVGVSASVGALMLSAVMVGNIGSKLLIGILTDILGAVKSVMVMTIATALAIVMIMLVHTDAILIVCSVLFGSIYSIGAVGLSLLTKQFFGKDNYTRAYSMICFGTNMGAAFAATAIGYIYDFFGSYYYAFIFMVGFLAICLVIVNTINHKQAK